MAAEPVLPYKMEQLIHYTKCPVCESEKITQVLTAKDYTVTGELFNIQHCNHCTARFTQGVPNAASIGRYYKSENYISHSNTSKGFINKLYQKVRSRTMNHKAGLLKKYTGLQTGRLLDVGCGTGTFLHAMQLSGWQVNGLEPDADARAVAKTMYGLTVHPSAELFTLEPESFNAITLWHVLEHVHQLHEYVEQLKKLLHKDGVLFIAVPNYTSGDAKAYKEFWAAYDVPRHLYHFSPTSLKMLMLQHGLHVTTMLPMWYDSFYVSLLSSKYKSGKTNYMSSGLHGLASNLNALGNAAACSSVIYIIKKN